MIRFLYQLPFALALFFVGCRYIAHKTVQPPASVIVSTTPGPAAAREGALNEAARSKAAAAAAAADHANDANPEGPAKATTHGEISVVRANLGDPAPQDLAAALERANAGLRGDLETANKAWTAAQSEAAQLRAQLAQAKADAEKERADNAAQLAAREAQWTDAFKQLKAQADERVAAASAAAEAEQRHLLNLIFHGGGAILVLLGIACITILSSVPFAGPRAGAGLIAAGAASISAGIAVNWMLAHPWAPILIIGLPIVAALALGFANHWHFKNSRPPAPAPVPAAS